MAYHLNEESIPLPTRPSTHWEPEKPGVVPMLCKHCGKGYSSHGAPRDHLACPASDEDWRKYYRQRALQSASDTLDMFRKDLAQLKPEHARAIVKTLYDELKVEE